MTPRQFRLFTVKGEEKKPMPQPSAFTRVIRIARSYHCHATACCDQIQQLALAAVVFMLAFAFVFDTAAQGQVPFASSSPLQSTAHLPADGGSTLSSDSGKSGDDRGSSTSSRSLTAPLTLSSDQIIHTLQQNPDLVVELKSQVADRLQQQGTEIDANDISDQMLYNQIATNADLRANITTFLRVRGYVSQDDLQAMGSTAGEGSANSDLFPGQHSLSPPGGVNSGELAADGGIGGAIQYRSRRSPHEFESTNEHCRHQSRR
jgi:hypothetical protein